MDLVHRAARGAASATAIRATPMSGDIAAFVREKLGHEPNDLRLFELALTHASVGGDSYERLEFLGDRVLGLVIAARAVRALSRTSPKASCRAATTRWSLARPAPRSARELGVPRAGPARQAGARGRRQPERQRPRRRRRGADRRAAVSTAASRRRSASSCARWEPLSRPRSAGAQASQVRASGTGCRARLQAAGICDRRRAPARITRRSSPSASRSPGLGEASAEGLEQAGRGNRGGGGVAGAVAMSDDQPAPASSP